MILLYHRNNKKQVFWVKMLKISGGFIENGSVLNID